MSVAQVQKVTNAYQLGAMRNALGILSEDRSKVVPQRLREVTHLTNTATAKTIAVSRPQVYLKEVKVNPKLMKHIISLVYASDLAYLLLGENIEETAKWAMSPNSLLKGDSPFEVCMRGDGEVVVNWLHTRLGNLPGQAF